MVMRLRAGNSARRGGSTPVCRERAEAKEARTVIRAFREQRRINVLGGVKSRSVVHRARLSQKPLECAS